MIPSEYNAFLNSLKVGNRIRVYEGGYRPDSLTEVTTITDKYIKVMCHPELRFDRQTGSELPAIKDGWTLRQLFSVKS